MAWLQFAALQSRTTVNQEVEEQAFAASEAGVEFVVERLTSGADTPRSLARQRSWPTVTLYGPTNNAVSTYDLSFSRRGNQPLFVVSVGRGINRPNECQIIQAIVNNYVNTDGQSIYFIDKSYHQPGNSCTVRQRVSRGGVY